MATETSSGIGDEERQMARTTAIGLGIWLALTIAAVVSLLLFGDAISSLFV
ncbi:hypothetical protein [Natrinema longum]|uniref:Uncharacterized protein n=1 Tax=Natrinema longum TaxID=370324 RepID=A0A8A2U7B2_9EURY|nr:hypothetical protein [Natrinema longum]MBZ6494136.1 hypothetical protein [Natrinema longum]QSW84534.1 hypothetical protein J0X27_13900 [Natrinema longum]